MTLNEYTKLVHTLSKPSIVKTLTTKQNTHIQKLISQPLSISVTTMDKIVNLGLQLKKAEKHSVHQFLLRRNRLI